MPATPFGNGASTVWISKIPLLGKILDLVGHRECTTVMVSTAPWSSVSKVEKNNSKYSLVNIRVVLRRALWHIMENTEITIIKFNTPNRWCSRVFSPQNGLLTWLENYFWVLKLSCLTNGTPKQELVCVPYFGNLTIKSFLLYPGWYLRIKNYPSLPEELHWASNCQEMRIC